MATLPLARTGGPLRPHTSPRYERFGVERDTMPHMPLDTGIHWHWRNPLNIIPATVIGVIIIDIIGFFL